MYIIHFQSIGEKNRNGFLLFVYLKSKQLCQDATNGILATERLVVTVYHGSEIIIPCNRL